jgi:glycosyltransferase involved in cell wall biosynthesis
MSLGVPVVSTAKGAEGIDYTDGKDILIADKENEFASRLVTLLQNKHQRIGIGNAARKLAESKYDWEIIGKNLQTFICEL